MNSNFITVKAVKGRTVFIPGSLAVVSKAGDRVERNLFWQRRIDDGDVALVTTEQKPPSNDSNKDKQA